MITGETQTGFKYSYNEKILQSGRFIDALIATDKSGYDSLVGLHDMTELLLGDNKDALYKHLEDSDPDGIATMTAIRSELIDMINKTGEGKN